VPGPLSHLFAADQILTDHHFQDSCIGAFLYGNVAPDLGYFPGSDQLWSDLPHYIGSVVFVKRMLEFSPNPKWKAFSKGWLLHLLLDLYSHPLINHFVARRYGSVGLQERVTYEENPIAHAKIETGLDLAILRELRSFRVLDMLRLPGVITEKCPLVQSFRSCYALAITPAKLQNSMSRHRRMLAGGVRCQSYLNGAGHQEDSLVSVGRSVTNILSLFFRISFGELQGGLMAALLQPDWPTTDDYANYHQAICNGVKAWEEIVSGESTWPEHDLNLDTGETSHRGEYKLADMAMDHLAELNTPERICERFGTDSEDIVSRWENILTRFEIVD